MNAFVMPLLGGMLIGLAGVSILFFNGRILGVSGIVGGLLRPSEHDRGWRWGFLSGLLVGGGLLKLFLPAAFTITPTRSMGALIIAGLLVGLGTSLGNGCTSGHGVCGISRLSPRSIAATLTFMAAGAAAVFIINHLLGGWV